MGLPEVRRRIGSAGQHERELDSSADLAMTQFAIVLVTFHGLVVYENEVDRIYHFTTLDQNPLRCALAEEMPDRRVALSLLAHPDDAEFVCAGTLCRLADAGWEIHIATSTPGDCGSAELSQEEIAEIRRGEGKAAADLIGAAYHCLEERDVNVVFDHASGKKAIDLFRKVAPSLVFAHPRLDYMLDHEQTHLMARRAAFAYPIPNASRLPRIEGSAVPWLYYCDPLGGVNPYNNELVQPSCRIDISAQFERKTEMLVCHASQREWLRSHHGMDEYVEAMKRHSAMRGKEIGVDYAEAFVQHLGHPYPTSDILTDLFGAK